MAKKGLVYTNENCVGCNKCIGVCSSVGAMIASEDDKGNNVITVDPDKCVACGACFDVCEHNARELMMTQSASLRILQKGRRSVF